MRAVQKSSYEIAKILLAHPEIDVNQVGTFRINQFNILLHFNIYHSNNIFGKYFM